MVLRGIDTMIRKTKDADLISKLRADRAALVEIYKAAQDANKEEEE
jgi:hypothetical protein